MYNNNRLVKKGKRIKDGQKVKLNIRDCYNHYYRISHRKSIVHVIPEGNNFIKQD